MKRFAALYEKLDATTSTNAKVRALVDYLRQTPAADAAWGLYFLGGRRPKRLVSGPELWGYALEATGLPSWLLEECQAATGDFAETIALVVSGVLPPAHAEDASLSAWMRRILALQKADEQARHDAVLAMWAELEGRELFLLNKLLTGAFRVGVSQTLVERAVAEAAGLPQATIAHRMMGDWEPSAEFVERLFAKEAGPAHASHPYPFALASPLDVPPADLGPRDDWLVEWKWDGIRAQIVRREGGLWVWSRGEALVGDRFPEVDAAVRSLPDGTVLDGEILAFEGERPLPFAALQKRIGRLKPTPKVLAEAPAIFMAYDVLEDAGRDVRDRTMRERRAILERLVAEHAPKIRVSPAVEGASWDELARLRDGSRERHVEGLMLKRWDAPYVAGRKRGAFWKWKIDPYTLDTVLVYANPGNGKRASLYTDCTFAIWKGGELVPVAKAYSGLTDAEIAELDRWIRAHTRERHGPVRALEPTQVFELAFEAIAPSNRHKSGIAVRFPRILRWRKDKRAEDADTVETARALLDAERK